MKITAHN